MTAGVMCRLRRFCGAKSAAKETRGLFSTEWDESKEIRRHRGEFCAIFKSTPSDILWICFHISHRSAPDFRVFLITENKAYRKAVNSPDKKLKGK